MKLKGKVAIVTGSGRGIGREIAELFASEGARVVVSARSSEQIAGVVEKIVGDGGEAIGVSIDVSREQDANRLVEETMARFGRVDILVNNAGILRSSPLVAFDPAEWRQVIEINLMGTFYCTRAVAPIMVERQWGRIINMASRSGKIGHPYLTPYCASKHGVVGFTKSLAEELAPFNITVNAICPGLVETDMVPDTIRQQAGGGIIKPRQIADLALYLASDSASAVNGESINIFGSTKLNLSF
ncbi:SDR family oxidoreductase [Candidatus Poribacteria bacterium]|nr:SDR family oxidoreductase [Candidatus Poribacteria bacterium]